MKVSGLLMVLVTIIIAASSCQDYFTRYTYVISTEPSSVPAAACSEQHTTHCLTLNELIVGASNLNETAVKQDANCVKKEFVFQSGSHIVKGNEKHFLLFENTRSITIRGQPNVTIINCLDDFCFVFRNVTSVKIYNVHVQNCSCSGGYGIHEYILESSSARIEIVDSRFTNSCIMFGYQRLPYYDTLYSNVCRAKSTKLTVTIRNVTVENCSDTCKSILDFSAGVVNLASVDLLSQLNITLHNLNVTDNDSPFLNLQLQDSLFFDSFITFTGCSHFTRNKGCTIVSVSARVNTLHFTRAEVYFINNTMIGDQLGSAASIKVERANIILEHSHVIFKNNQGGIVAQYETKVVFGDNVTVHFINNTGQNGGAMSLYTGSTLVFTANKLRISLNFTNNTAHRGGAIYAGDISAWNREVTPVFDLQCNITLVELTFCNNSALFGGNHIYGGWVGWFLDERGVTGYNFDIVKTFLIFENGGESEIASDPIRICLCINSRPDCNVTKHSMEVYGHALRLSLVAVGQRYTLVPAYVEASLTSWRSKSGDEEWLHVRPGIEILPANCTDIIYRIYSDGDTLMLKPRLDYHSNQDPQGPPKTSDNTSMTEQALLVFQQLSIQLRLRDCPLGFFLHETDRNCVCQPLILGHGLTCDVTESAAGLAYRIHRNKHQWANVTYSHLSVDESPGVIVHQHCPLDYCKVDNMSLSIRLENQDEQCAFNRTGILCGGCQTKFSRVLGSSKCKMCSSLMLLVLLPTGLLAGLLLVVLLMALNLTVSVGTINGLIFYANIIELQRITLLSPGISNSFLSIFIAWLNLDIGIELCFYNGLDSYSETWLQLLFPLYIWLLVILIIATSHFSIRISKLSGKNAVQVLATLFLLSYTKLLQFVITSVSSTTITYPDGYTKVVWLHDGNIDFLMGKHIPLFIVAVFLLILLSVPYTLSLLSIQWLHKISHYRAMFWIQRLKPIFDAYTGPYRANHRYWTGLLLLARIVLVSVFSLNQSINPTNNLFAIAVISVGLLTYFAGVQGTYQNRVHNCLELIFLCNLCLTSVAVLFELSNDKRSPIPLYMSTVTAFVTFVGIIIYHAQRQLLLTSIGAKLKNKILRVSKNNSEMVGHLGMQTSTKVTSTVVELKEPLLEENDS